MTKWVDLILTKFPVDVARFWIAADPDNLLLDERLLSLLRDRGFEVLPFEDSAAFRAEYEERYRAAWDRGEPGPSTALILQLRGTQVRELPWDYLRQARQSSLSLSALFSKLSSSIVRQLDSELLPPLFEAQQKYAHHVYGEAATKEFVLAHLFGINPHGYSCNEDLWRELLRLHRRELTLPPILAQFVGQVADESDLFKKIPVAELFASRSLALRTVREAWCQYVGKLGGTRLKEPPPPEYVKEIDIPFESSEIMGIVNTMFLDGTLHPLMIDQLPDNMPKWAANGVVQDPASMRNLLSAGINTLMQELPTADSTHKEWAHFAQRLAELLSRFYTLDPADAKLVEHKMTELRQNADHKLLAWVGMKYGGLSLLTIDKGPMLVSQVLRSLAYKRDKGEGKIALVVLDGMSMDQWVLIKEHLWKRSKRLAFEENGCFALIPTMTSVSRQALFSGLRPREFADSIDTTSREPAMWTRFWQDHGLRVNEIFYRKSQKRIEDLTALDAQLSGSAVKVAGIVVDTIDDFVHGAVLGKRDIASRIATWCDTNFMDRLFGLLLEKGFHVYVTSDHGNVEATGIGRPNQGGAPEMRAERVRIYSTEDLIAESAASIAQTFRLEIPGLPSDFKPLFASGYGAFVREGDHLVAHGGVSVEELLVPFIKVKYASKTE